MDILKIESTKQLITYTSKIYSPISVGESIYCATENGDILQYSDG